MKILITGGAGFIGSHIVDAYINDGREVVIVDNFSTGRHENVNQKAKLYEMDICDPKISEIFLNEKPDVLNHHAAQIDVRTSVEDPLFDLKVNVGGFINLMEAAKNSGVKKVIFASSGGAVYGEQETYPAPESHQVRPVCPYGLNKLSCEQYLHFYEQVYEIKWTALRYGNVYGPRQNPHGEAGVVAIFLNRMLKGEQPVINGDGKQTRDYVYISDVVEANRLALKSDAHGPYNVGTGVETDVNTIFRALRELWGSRCEVRHGPAKAGEQKRVSIDAARIKRELGWHPQVSFAEGMKLTAGWFRERYLI